MATSVHVKIDYNSDNSVENDRSSGEDVDTTNDDSSKQFDQIRNDDASESEDLHTENFQHAKAGLANAMSKILSRSLPLNKHVILARGQTDREILRKKHIRDVEKKTEKSSDSEDSEDDSPEGRRKALLKKQQKKEWENMSHTKPNPLEKDKERNLYRIATKGVVLLFNAVQKQQSLIGERLSEAGSSEHRREKVLGEMNKKNFLSLLDNTQPSVLLKSKQAKKQLSVKLKSWSILQEDYMLGAKMKDWDKED